jgi:hypothetical protein
MINGVRVRCFTVELSPTRWKGKFGRMDVSEARRGQPLITVKTDYHLAIRQGEDMLFLSMFSDSISTAD